MPGKMVYVKMNKTKAGQPGHWKEEKKIEAVTTYLSTGNYAETSRLCGVPLHTIDSWKESDWWKEMIKKIHSEEDAKLDAKLSKIIDKTLEKLIDTVENGEHIYDQRTGKIKRMPAKLRDVNNAFNTILDKRQLIRKQPTKIVEQQNTAAQLQTLADQFAKFVGKTIKSNDAPAYIDGDTVVQNADGVYELKE